MEQLTRDAIEILLTKHRFEDRPDLRLDAFDRTIYRVLDTGQLLFYRPEGPGILMPSLAAFLEARNRMPTGAPRHVLAGLTSSREGFLALIPTAAAQISRVLGLPSLLLDQTFGSLHPIDDALHRGVVSQSEYEQQLYLPLIAYLGVCILHEKGGRWDLRYDETAGVWEPFVVLPSGKEVNLFIDLYEDAQEDYAHLSVFVISQLRLEHL